MINALDHAYIVPVAGCAMVLGLGVMGIYSEMERTKLRAQQRMTLVARNLPAEEIEKLLGPSSEDDAPARDPLRSLGTARRTATVLISCGLGIIVFGLLLAFILQFRTLLIVPAAGIIPIAVGLGFLADYRLQARELARFGLEVGAENPPPTNK